MLCCTRRLWPADTVHMGITTEFTDWESQSSSAGSPMLQVDVEAASSEESDRAAVARMLKSLRKEQVGGPEP